MHVECESNGRHMELELEWNSTDMLYTVFHR
jgi:hypothetical protein